MAAVPGADSSSYVIIGYKSKHILNRRDPLCRNDILVCLLVQMFMDNSPQKVIQVALYHKFITSLFAG